ncbi:hypothetical protein [Sedimentibacter sp.]|uniref:hypothetical protein n=1 Tax=Sedimentibacter sp. TaxID=1960295 RepID=UPI00289FA710|nr:hypothetical protein [Sedimentibacter sp.]
MNVLLKILADGERVWKDDRDTQTYTGDYFPFRWLYAEEEWEFINTNSGKIWEKFPKKGVLREKFKNITTKDYNTNMCAAFELKVICKFYYDNILIDIDHKMKINKRNVDAPINIDNRELLVEVTSYAMSNIPFGRVGMIPSDKYFKQVTKKLNSKNERQLRFSDKPLILVTTLIPNSMQNHLHVKNQ